MDLSAADRRKLAEARALLEKLGDVRSVEVLDRNDTVGDRADVVIRLRVTKPRRRRQADED